jgi:sensor histidine kinase YesM
MTAQTEAKPPAPGAPSAPGTPLRRRVWGWLNSGGLGVAIGFAITTALMLSPVFTTSFAVLLGRTLFLALMLLLVFEGAQRLPERHLPRWLPRWVFSTLAVALATPLVTLAIYLASVGGRMSEFIDSAPRIQGFVIITFTSLVLGLLVTLTAQLREREARARTLALELELQGSRIEKLALDAQLALLRAQIQPHFLFNTLANVQALVESGSPRAGEVLGSLVAYLRATLPRLGAGSSTLGDELSLVQAYLDLMRLRMPDRLSYAIDADAALHGRRFPSMALLTLVENAVRHGIDPSEEGGHIEVGASGGEGGLRLWVTDSGVGLSEHAVPGTGLTNLRATLATSFGPQATLTLSENAPRGLRAEIVLPS